MPKNIPIPEPSAAPQLPPEPGVEPGMQPGPAPIAGSPETPIEGAPAEGTGVTGMASEEMRRVILDEINKLKNQNNAFNAGEFVQFNKLQEKKKDSVEMFFQLLSNLGVDPSDLGSINEFLSRLEQTNPDLFIMFESAFKRIFGEEAIGQQEGGPTAPPVSPDMAAATPPPSMVTEGLPMPGGEMPGGQMPGNGGGMPPVSESPAGPEAGQAPGLMGRFSNLQEQLLRK